MTSPSLSLFMSDAFHAHQKLPLKASSGAQRMFSETRDMGGEISVGNVNEMDVYGTGLKNEIGEYNCFLNVIIQVSVYKC